MRLLIVDDHQEVRILIRHVAAAAATSVRECGNGREAVELAREFKPHCITLDIRLPGLSGIDAASAIRAVHPSARIAMVSSYDGPELRQAARLAGARCYVVKDHLMDLGTWLAEQAELAQMRQSSERARELEHLTADIAHDFNNVLSPIGMMVQLAQVDNAQPELVSTLEQIDAAVKRGQKMVKQLLARRSELVQVRDE